VRIDGRTRPAGVVGWPVAHSLSPAMHNAAYEALGLNWAYLPFAIPDQSALSAFVDSVRRLPFVGFNVTMPYKQAMLELCDEVAALATMAGAVNTVHVADGQLIGYNTDGRGLVEALADEAGFDPTGKTVAIIGAGGAAGAAVTGFVLAKAAEIAVVNRDVGRAEDLFERITGNLRGTTMSMYSLDSSAAMAVHDADLVVNATPLGLGDADPSPIPASWFRAGQVAYDMIYRAGTTGFLSDAAAAGARTHNGLGMLVSQGALAIDIWAGAERAQLRAPRDVMRSAAESAMNTTPSEDDVW